MSSVLRTAIAALAAVAAMAATAQPAVACDLGGKFDKSFNEAAFCGVER